MKKNAVNDFKYNLNIVIQIIFTITVHIMK